MKHLWALVGFWAAALWLGYCLYPARLAAADTDVCAVCGEPIIDVYYGFEDQVTLQKCHVCKHCEQAYPECFVCSLPANTNAPSFTRLPDGRVICARDAKTAVLEPEEGMRICREVRDGLDRLFSRFTTFPETNVAVGMVDRVHLQDLFKLAGNDYHCPNVWGYTEPRTNHNRLEYRISLMSGLPLSWFQATCAHEYSHTWVGDHLFPTRKEGLGKDAEEGFCELVSFLYMDSLHDEAQQAKILRNGYTRGQIDLFVAAERNYGFNEVLDWMQFGIDDQLSATDPGRLRNVASQRRTNPPAFKPPLSRSVPASVPDTLVLKGIFWDQKRPLALINDCTLAPDQQASVRVGTTNVLVHCLSISADSVQLRVAGSQTEQTLRLKAK
jgi:hypothetical protein